MQSLTSPPFHFQKLSSILSQHPTRRLIRPHCPMHETLNQFLIVVLRYTTIVNFNKRKHILLNQRTLVVPASPVRVYIGDFLTFFDDVSLSSDDEKFLTVISFPRNWTAAICNPANAANKPKPSIGDFTKNDEQTTLEIRRVDNKNILICSCSDSVTLLWRLL